MLIALLLGLAFIVGLLVSGSLRDKRAGRTPTTSDLVQYTPHQAKTRHVILHGQHSAQFLDRIALSNTLDEIAQLPTADVPPVIFQDDEYA